VDELLMARFKPARTFYRLTFEDPELAGLEVTTRKISLEGLLEIVDMIDVVQGFDSKNIEPVGLKMVKDLFARFAAVLSEWNVDDDDDQPVPCTIEGLLSLEAEFVLAVIEAWVRAMSQAPPPLPGESSSGSSSPEKSLAAASVSRPPQS
jgi:hypothetical protein